MAEDVIVQFGAKIDDLIKGVDEVKSKIESINSSTDSLSGGFARLRDIIIAAFSVDQLIRFIERMAELGLQTERTMAILGISAEQVGVLRGMAALTGTSMDSLTVQINRFALNVQRSTADAVNPHAEALRVLGLRSKDLIGVPASEYIDKLRDAVSKFNPSLNLTNALTAIGGRGFAQMLPFLQLNKVAWDELQKAIKDAQEGLARAIPGMAETHANLTIMGLAFESVGVRLFAIFKPAIDAVVQWLTQLAESLTEERLRSGINTLGNALIDFVVTVMSAFSELGITLDTFESKATRTFFDISVREGSFAAAVLAIISKFKEMIPPIEGTDKATSTALANMDEKAKQAREAIEALAASWRAMLSAATSGIAFVGPLLEQGGPKKIDARAMNEGLAKAMSDRLKIINDEYKLESDIITKQYGDFFFNEKAKTDALLTALGKRFEAEVAAGEKTNVAYAKYALDRQKILDAANKSYEAALNNVFSGIQSAFNSQLRGMLAGTTSFAKAFKTILGDMIIWAIQEFEKMAFKWIAHEVIQTTATEAGVTARTASEAGGAAVVSGLGVATAIRSILNSAAQTFAGVFAFLSEFMGPAAAAPAAASSASVASMAGLVAAAATGTDYVARTGLAVIHTGEAVVPAQFNTPFTGGSMGATNVSLNINAVDARSFASLVQSNPSIFTNLIRKAMRDNQLNLATVR